MGLIPGTVAFLGAPYSVLGEANKQRTKFYTARTQVQRRFRTYGRSPPSAGTQIAFKRLLHLRPRPKSA